MANNSIVISRIQNRRGRRENLPQPLLPGEIALTADTGQAWIGSDPELSVPSVEVYADKNQTTAQNIVDNNIVEAVFNPSFSQTNFNTLVTELLNNGTVSLIEDDIRWDSTQRGTILSINVDSAGSGYTTGDTVTAVSPTGSGFVGTVVDDGSGGIDSVNITNGGQGYLETTTFNIANGTGGQLSITQDNIHGTSVFVAADTSVDSNNTINNIGTAINNTGPNSFLTTPQPNPNPDALGGTFSNGVLLLNNQLESSHVSDLINRINANVPGENVGLVHNALNIEITSGSGSSSILFPYELGFYLPGIVSESSATRGRFTFTQNVVIPSSSSSQASCGIVSVAQQDFDLHKNGVSFGTVSFPTSSATGTVSIPSNTSFSPGDVLEIIGPASPDNTQDQISITLVGELSI